MKIDKADGSSETYLQRFSTGRNDGESYAKEYELLGLISGFFNYLDSCLQRSADEKIDLRVVGGRARREYGESRAFLMVMDPFVPDRVSLNPSFYFQSEAC